MANKYTPLDLASFDISETTGFLRETKVWQLPPYFQAWHDLLDVLHRDDPELNKANFRQMVVEMPILDHSSLTTDEANLAHAILSFCAHSYVWRYEVDTKVEFLPASLSVPWKGVADMLDVLPAFVYNDSVLCTMQRKDFKQGYTFDNLSPAIFRYPGNELLMYSASMEVEFATGLKHIVDGDRCIYENNEVGLTHCLRSIQVVLMNFCAILPHVNTMSSERMYKFTLQLIKSWGKEEHAPYQDGLIYEGFETLSAGQSSIFQVLDAFLGIVHSTESREHFLTLRRYMPPKHRRFINTLESRNSALTLVKKSKSKDLIGAYNSCIDEIRYFRTFHAMLVNKYVNKEAAKRNEPYSDDMILSLKASRNTTKPYKVDED